MYSKDIKGIDQKYLLTKFETPKEHAALAFYNHIVAIREVKLALEHN